MDPCLINPPYYTHFDTHISPYYIDFNTHTSFHLLLKNTYCLYPILMYFLPILIMHPFWHLIFRLSLLGYILWFIFRKVEKLLPKIRALRAWDQRNDFLKKKFCESVDHRCILLHFIFHQHNFRRRDIAKGTMDQRGFADGTALTWFFLLLRPLWFERKPFFSFLVTSFSPRYVTSTIKNIFIFQVV